MERLSHEREEEIKQILLDEMRRQGYPVNGDPTESRERERDFMWVRTWRHRLDSWERNVGRVVITLFVTGVLAIAAFAVGLKTRIFG